MCGVFNAQSPHGSGALRRRSEAELDVRAHLPPTARLPFGTRRRLTAVTDETVRFQPVGRDA